MKPIVAIIGRPNVGKSTFFNRLVEERRSIVADVPGTTRDRVYGDTEWLGVEFTVIDTGGLQSEDEYDRLAPRAISERTQNQAQLAVDEADVLLFLVDGMSGVTAADHEVAELVRRSGKPTVLAVNKTESDARRDNAIEFYELGLGEPIAFSGMHAIGTADVLDAVVPLLPRREVEPDKPEYPAIAIVGRPNVGKSELVNALLGRERTIVSEVAGTTRDSIDSELDWMGNTVTLIDTAGIRRRGRVEVGIERYSVVRSMRAIDRADVAVLVVDAVEGFTAQDAHIAGHIVEAQKGVVIAVNKWDAIEKDDHTMPRFRAEAAEFFSFIPYAPLIFISATTHQRIEQTLEMALDVYGERYKRVSTGELNRMLRELTAKHPPPSKPGSWLKFYYATQADVAPPRFVFFCNNPRNVHFSYERYIENAIRDNWAFAGTPIVMHFRSHRRDD